ncbi:radical SAM/SPASM domain-containing protein [Chloroflexota bacterium]
MIDLNHYTSEHRIELENLLGSQKWQEVFSSGLVDEVKNERIEPGTTRDYIETAVSQLIRFNEAKVNELITQNYKDNDYLFNELSKWPANLDGENPILSFVGFNVTASCNFQPKCIYCNQPWVESSVDVGGWKNVVEDITANNKQEGPYIYITGGEPLILGEEIWGEDGIVKFASERGAAVNVNTNAITLTPEVALRLIKAGLSKLHISLDTSDKTTQNYLIGEHFDQILEGIYNIQLARDIIGVSYPVIHTNCVLTNRNLDLFPELFAFILEKHKQTVDSDDPLYNDLFPHVIPVGGKENDWLRPSEDEFRRFYEGIWPEVCRMWDSFQENFGVAQEDRGVLFGYFSNPYLRVEHEGGFDAYVRVSTESRYGKLALRQYCYVAPTQASFTPDGYQYRCGSHAIRRIAPIGNIRESGIFENIRAGISGLDELPEEENCYGCALASLWINQSVDSKLREKLESMLDEK